MFLKVCFPWTFNLYRHKRCDRKEHLRNSNYDFKLFETKKYIYFSQIINSIREPNTNHFLKKGAGIDLRQYLSCAIFLRISSEPRCRINGSPHTKCIRLRTRKTLIFNLILEMNPRLIWISDTPKECQIKEHTELTCLLGLNKYYLTYPALLGGDAIIESKVYF